ncbi:FG-GAP-like repeat-containing protein [Phaeodactylibacter xiamenensis]|uniref:FG-GAP-like repeat-containing protein n=2 Tax=Phaeodactylibacter xiamenensis TaxID=1524460 RepID=UPI003CCBBB71
MSLLFASCQNTDNQDIARKRGTFVPHDEQKTGIDFANTLTETEDVNVLSYEYFYNGGGIAVGDLNQDSLPDLYFTGNMVPNALYLNQGGLQFKAVTETAGVAGRKEGWNTGTTLVDINNDGLLDIYLCYSGDKAPGLRRNELYINQGNNSEGVPTFREEAAKYGLDLPSYSTQALFFDYDRDGDLDCYLLNHSIEDFQSFDATHVKALSDELAGDKLLRNDNGQFTEATADAGIKSTPLGFGLGIAASDVNGDGWTDLYVSNDYIEEDYLYINQKDGTFKDELKQQIGHISHFSMGSDIADFNNDALPDIFSLDMLPEDNHRQKLLYGPDTYEKYQYMLRNGFYHQIMRNMLQLNNGDGTFSEIGQLAGVSNTDWSWAPLLADFDNDGWKDLFVSNGYLRDYTNRDFVSYYADQRIKEQRGEKSDPLLDIIARMESTKTPNYIFRNNGDLTFTKKSADWGFDELVLSNGAVHADLDLDGDLDLVINNVNAPARIYENQVANGHYLKVNLMGNGSNLNAVGAKVTLEANSQIFMQEFIPSRGFQSAMHLPLHFGLGEAQSVDKLTVFWPDGTTTVLRNIPADQTLTVDIANAQPANPSPATEAIFSPLNNSLPFAHQENQGVDFKQQTLLPYALSYMGPAVATADFNGDGRTDLFAGGAKMQAGQIFLQQTDGSWAPSLQPALTNDLIMEDVAAAAFDADGDGDTDLYVSSGGYHYLPEDLALQDRLYLNDGSGQFEKATRALPLMRSSSGTVAVADFDGDGDQDIFAGGRLIPGKYPLPARSYLLENNGQGEFKEVTAEKAPGLEQPGMVTTALWEDLNGDSQPDLVLAGEWMPLTVFLNQNGQLQRADNFFGEHTDGWWWSMAKADLDGDGDTDLIAGNLGQNTNLKVSAEEPATLYYGDFDENGAVDPLITHYIQGEPYPFVSRDNLFGQLAAMRKKFRDYASYSDAKIEDVLSPEQLEGARQLHAKQGKTIWLENQGDGNWAVHELPAAAQMSPVFAILPLDANKDGLQDFILAGNLSETRPTMGPWDANYGQLFLNRGDGQFEYIPQHQSGLSLIGDVRRAIALNEGQTLLFFRNNQSVLAYNKNKTTIN